MKKKTILIVDDEKKIRQMYKQILEKEGFIPLEAYDAVTARRILMQNDVDLVLLDLNMPWIKGGELFYIMKAFHSKSKVIVSSVYSIDEQQKAAPTADDYFDKSEGLKTLIKKISFQLNEPKEKKKVIIIDDDPKIRFLYRRILETKGYEAICFNDSKSAIQFLKKKNNRFHLILLDISMPNLDAQITYSLIREKHHEAKVLVVSNYDEKYQEKLVPQADGYVDKSDGNDCLINKVEEILA